MADDVSDEICDSWEDMIENGVLEKKLEELKVKAVDTTKNGKAPQMHLEDTTRTQYVITVPQVKILKRPTDAKVGQYPSNEKSPTKQPLKTLEQREAEYAEARLRILGSAQHVEMQESLVKIANNEGFTGSSGNVSDKFVIRQPKGPDGSKGFSQER